MCSTMQMKPLHSWSSLARGGSVEDLGQSSGGREEEEEVS